MDEEQKTTPYERLIIERKELDDKLRKLNAFLKSDNIQSISPTQLALLNTQSSIMEAYSTVLFQRIIHFNQ